MNEIEKVLRQPGKKVIPFITCGDPDESTTLSLIHLFAEEGAAAIELGVPYSDPLADGPVIQAASDRALRNGMTLKNVLALGRRAREEGITTPLILFSYINPLLRFGMEDLVKAAKESGFAGLIIPDLPYEESRDVRKWTEEQDLALIPLVAPTSSKRLHQIVQQAQGFVYCVSSLGTTGMRHAFSFEVDRFLQQVKALSPVPIAVGFGISQGEQVTHFSQLADGVIVGSAFVKEVEKAQGDLTRVRQFYRSLLGEDEDLGNERGLSKGSIVN